MTNHIKDKVMIVTGAGGGFGQLICEKTAALGARVVAADINKSAVTTMVDGIKENGGTATAFSTDVTNRQQMHELNAAAVDAYGQVDVMVNNAGVMPLAYYSDHEQAADAWEKCIDINFKGVLNGIAGENQGYDDTTHRRPSYWPWSRHC